MKSKTKVLSLMMAAVLLVTAGTFGTVAYLTDNEEVTNTFTVGNVDITLDEAEVNLDGTTVEGADRVKENTYKLLPGHTYTKDPIVHVSAGSEDCYLFVKVVNGIAAIEGETTIANQMTEKGWVAVAGAENVYVYTAGGTNPVTVSANTNVPVFVNFTVKGETDNNTLAEYNGKTITVTAYAIQADGFDGKTAAEIWTAGFGN